MNEHDVFVAAVEVFEADNSTTINSMVALTGQTNPLRRWGDRAQIDLPSGATQKAIVTMFFPTAPIKRGTKDSLRLGTQIDVWSSPSSTGRAWKIADRVETLMTNSNLVSTTSTARTVSVDVAPYLQSRRDLPQEEGRVRVMLEYEIFFNRS